MTVAAPSPAPLQPLAEALAAVPSPAAVLDWLDQPHIRDLLTHLAAGQAGPHPRGAGWLAPPAGRASTCGICWSAAERCPLPTSSCANSRRGWTAAWKTWPGTRTCGCCASSGCGTSSPAMRARAAGGPLRTTAAQYARSRFIQAQAFLTWTDALGVRPSALTQAHIDAYYASHASHQREGVRAFLVWAAGHGHIPGHLDSPRQQPYTGQVITQQRRLDLLRRFATDEAIPIRTRAAACLMLLYAQPLSRILRLSAADLSRDDDGQTWLRLGDPPSPVPAPFGALLHQLAATRHDHVPANHGSDWLFPGRNAGAARRLPADGRPAPRARAAAAHRPDLRAAATRPAGPRPRHRRRPRLPPHHHHPPARQGSRTVEPVRRRRPRTLITPGAGPYRPGCGQDRTASRIGPRRNPLRLARATGTRLSVCAAASASRSTPNCQDSRSSAAPGHSLSAIQRSMSSQVLGRVSAGSAQAASSISVMMYPGAS